MSGLSRPESLSTLLSMARNNAQATEQNYPDLFAKLEAVHDTFTTFIGTISSPKHIVARYFLLRTHSSFIAAANLATSTQVADSFAVTRLVLENAVYAHYISSHPDLFDLWLNRQDSEETRKASRSKFKIGTMMTELDVADAQTGGRYRRLYSDVLDYGAHPNVASILPNTDHTETEDGIEVRHNYFSANRTNIELALKTLARSGALTFDIFSIIWQDDKAITALKPLIHSVQQEL